MKIVTIQQNTRVWHDWRGKGLGASDAPAVMGESPYQTVFGLWGEKTGIVPRTEPNAFAVAAMKRGQELEPEARDLYERLTGRVTGPLAAEHDEYSFIRASFDGIEAPNTSQCHFVEIKCPGQVAHEEAKAGKVPDYYYSQVQQQFLVSGAKTGDYFSYRPGDSTPHVILPVKPDPLYQKRLLVALIDFWKLVQTQTPPEVGRAEFVKTLRQVVKDIDRIQQLMHSLVLMEGTVKKEQAPRRGGSKPNKEGFFKVS